MVRMAQAARLPALCDGSISLATLRRWAEEFDTESGRDRYRAMAFVDYLADNARGRPRRYEGRMRQRQDAA